MLWYNTLRLKNTKLIKFFFIKNIFLSTKNKRKNESKVLIIDFLQFYINNIT